MELARLKVRRYAVRNRSISLIQGKSGKEKVIFLTDDEATFFDKQIAGKAQDELIFRRADGEPWGKSNQQERMEAALKAAGIRRHVRFHDMRHTFATLLAINGVSMPGHRKSARSLRVASYRKVLCLLLAESHREHGQGKQAKLQHIGMHRSISRFARIGGQF